MINCNDYNGDDMNIKILNRKIINLLSFLILVLFSYIIIMNNYILVDDVFVNNEAEFIKWVDFKVTSKALEKAYKYDVDSYNEEVKLDFIELLSILACKYGGDFSKYKEKDLDNLVRTIKEGSSIEELTKDLKYYNYYHEAYDAVLGGLLGEYEIEIEDATTETGKSWEQRYGLKAFLPIARNFPYNHYDDFGVSRSYGYKRRHLGHDMMGQVGTPIIAIESGYIEAMGWNKYGGWRLGIRSFDGKRYYYYAHLRRNYPYNKSLELGSVVSAGDVIGYMGRSGYSLSENTNNINVSHLHLGIQLIFDESQKEGASEIWIDCYEIVKFLYKNRSLTLKDQETKEYNRVYNIKDPAVEEYINRNKPPIDEGPVKIRIY